MSKIPLLDRREVICQVFCQAYFGHVLLEKGIWQELERYLDTYFASIERNKHRKLMADDEPYFEAFIKLVKELIFIVTKHSLNRFPVSLMHKRKVIDWLVDYLRKNSSDNNLDETLSRELSVLELKGESGTEIEQEDPEYIYKTFLRVGTNCSSNKWCYVTLLEENRDIIGHGTTGLTSWQGAMFLADWCQAQQDTLKVRQFCYVITI